MSKAHIIIVFIRSPLGDSLICSSPIFLSRFWRSWFEELKSESDAVAPFCDGLIQLAENFDFDGIQKILLGLDS